MESKIILETFLKWRKIFYRFFFTALLIVILVTFLIPRKYVISTTLMPYKTQLKGQILPSEYIRLLENIPKGFGSFITPFDILAGLAQKGEVIVPVIKKLNLIDTFKAEDMEDAILKFLSIYNVSVTDEGMVSISLIYKHPETGVKILNEILKNLENFIRKIHTQFYVKREKLIQQRFNSVKKELKAVEDSFKTMQEKYRTHSLEGEFGEYIYSFEKYAELKKEEIEAEINYKTLLSIIKDTNNIEIKKAKRKYIELKNKIKEIEKGSKKEKGFGAGFGLPLEKVPEASIVLMRLWRKQKTLSELYTLLLEELEKTKIEASKSIPFFSVVSKPSYSKRNKVPKRSMVLIGGIILSLFFSILLVYFLEFLERVRTDKNLKPLREFFTSIGRDFRVRKK